MIITIVLTLLALACATLTILSKYRQWKRLEYVFKPMTMFWIILIALLESDPVSSTYQQLILGALLVSLAGDMYLLLPDKFIWGLGSFLIAHALYFAAFTVEIKHNPPLWYGIPFVLYGVLMVWRLWPYLGDMRLPVIGYVCMILLMVWQADNRWLETQEEIGAILALAGAYLFVASDSVLAVERFRGTWRSAPFWVLTTYFAAQWLLALSV